MWEKSKRRNGGKKRKKMMGEGREQKAVERSETTGCDEGNEGTEM